MKVRPEWENRCVLAVIDALVGAITPNMAAIALEVDPDELIIDVHVALNRVDEVDAEELDDLGVEVDALMEEPVLVRVHPWTGDDWTQGWAGRDQRLIYAAHRPD